MTTTEEAFAKFEIWSKSQTFLKLTVIDQNKEPQILRGQIISVDERLSLICFSVNKSQFPRLDLSGAAFRAGKHVVEAQRGEDFQMFEELPVSLVGK